LLLFVAIIIILRPQKIRDKMSSKISPGILLMIEDLFNRKKWEVQKYSNDITSLFEKFCARLRLLSNEQQKLVIDLTENFIRIELSEYLERFYDSLLCVKDEVFNSKEKLFVYPLINPYIEHIIKQENLARQVKIPYGKTKSSQFLHYMLASANWTWISEKLILSESISTLSNRFRNEDSMLFLIDDYVGTGLTAIGVCRQYLSESFKGETILPENIKIICIAAQKVGISRVRDELGIEVISNLILTKGISDRYSNDEISQKLKLMEDIELEIGGIKESYRFGLEKSEGLITFLNKTPNNTFPVYWHETKTKVAPFPRYKNYFGNG
jgi:hypothetical protein